MTAAALPRRSDATLPRPVAAALEFLRLLSRRPSGLIGFIGIVFFLVLSSTGWAGLMRQVRAQVLTLKERDYVEAARSLDLGNSHIIFREILPNMRSYIVIHFVQAVTGAIYAQVALIVLGLVPFSGKNWALMLYFANTQGAFYFKDAFWFVFSPILAIILLQLSLVLFVNALEDIFNPRLRSS